MLDNILGIINKFIPDQDKAKELEAKVMSEHIKAIEKVKIEQANIIKKEQSMGGITAKWRPYLMVLCMSMIGIHFLLTQVLPFMIVTSGLNIYYPILDDLSPELWGFLRLGIGGYIGARSLEKIVQNGIKAWRAK